jgi:hypothetical protein
MWYTARELDRQELMMTSIGFGGGEVIQVDLSLGEVRKLLEDALNNRKMLEIRAQNGETVLINPDQVKVLQNSTGGPESFPSSQSELAAQH